VYSENVNLKGKQMLVKFTKHYSFHAHNACALHNFAPTIFACVELPNAWKMVIMELITESVPYFTLSIEEKKNIYHAQLVDAINSMHTQNFVHGDLRPNNFIIHKGSQRLFIIDFDWAGEEGVVCYPAFMNHKDVEWHENAEVGKIIKKEHDLHLLKNFFL
jgi:thiamine kinase-like enzyme